MPATPLLWDIFCRVVDNHGDLGVCWRLARELAARGHELRLWVDDARALDWMAPGALQGAVPGVRVLPWTASTDTALLNTLPHARVWIEAFGCELPAPFIAHRATAVRAGGAHGAAPPVWINLEYLSAERYVERMHGLPSPVLHGPAAGWTKWFFYPGFTPRTGGLLRERELAERESSFDRAGWRARHGAGDEGTTLISLFCYEPPGLGALLAQLRRTSRPTRLLVTAGRASQAVRSALDALPPLPPAGEGWGEGRDASTSHAVTGAARPPPSPFPLLPAGGEGKDSAPVPYLGGVLHISYLPQFPQTGYDELLWGCELNFVRGEDSLVRALWAGRPFVWQVYPQHDQAHHAKLEAFLDWLQAPPSLRCFHRVWNGIEVGCLPAPDLPAWHACALAARERLLAQQDLCTQLTGFVAEKR